jgi:predicted nucleotidyltransferase
MNNRRSNTNDVRMRQRLAVEAARIMTEEHLSDFYRAKHKAAARLGANNTRNLPRNDEIEKALVEYQRLFRGDSQPARLRRLRESALRAMEFLGRFMPRLVGSVLRGTADEHSEVALHVFAHTPEEVGFFLMEQNIPHQFCDKRVTLVNGEAAVYPGYRFIAEDVPFLLVVFPANGIRQALRSEVDGRPVHRATLGEVRMLLEIG